MQTLNFRDLFTTGSVPATDVLSGFQIIPIGTIPVQAWVMPVMRADGRFSVGVAATRIPP